MSEQALEVMRKCINPERGLCVGRVLAQELWDACLKGADEIDRLEAENKRLREAIIPVVEGDLDDPICDDEPVCVPIGKLLALKQALEQS